MIIAIDGGISLPVREPEREIENYLSCRIQKGLILVHDNKDLSEEGVGFGVPVLKFGQKTIFPGNDCITIRKGLAYSLSPHLSNFAYDIRIGAGK